MAKKTEQKVRKKIRTSKASRRGALEAKKSEATTGAKSATTRFVNDLMIRGEAARAPDGKLPLEATHVIEKQNEDGTATVRRVRYKLF